LPYTGCLVCPEVSEATLGVMQRFRARLKGLRREKRLTQEALAVRAGMTLQHYQNIECGKTPQPSVQKVIDLAFALEVSIEELLILEVEVRSRGRPRKTVLEEGATSG